MTYGHDICMRLACLCMFVSFGLSSRCCGVAELVACVALPVRAGLGEWYSLNRYVDQCVRVRAPVLMSVCAHVQANNNRI